MAMGQIDLQCRSSSDSAVNCICMKLVRFEVRNRAAEALRTNVRQGLLSRQLSVKYLPYTRLAVTIACSASLTIKILALTLRYVLIREKILFIDRIYPAWYMATQVFPFVAIHS